MTVDPLRSEPLSAGPRRYLNPHTLAGVDLSRESQVGATSFIVHECGYLARCRNWNHRSVQSPFSRLIYNFAPGNHIVQAGRRISLTPSAILLLPADVKFDGHGPAEPPHLWLHFSPLREFTVEKRGPLEVAPTPASRHLLERIRSAHGEVAGPLRLKRLYHLSSALLHVLYADLDAMHHQVWPERLYELLSHIQANPRADLANPVLARRCGMSVEAFIRWFHRETGWTPADYVSRTRIKLAAQRLILSGATIEQIAEELGFPNRAYFSRVFSRQMGCGPATFRRRKPRV
jgi:AraC family transcriptional regulator of arabinose operon